MYAGALIGRYVVEKRLGAGSFATVWLADDEELQSKVAIKILADNWSESEDVRSRFLREARILRQLDFGGIVRVYDIGTLQDGRPYFAMEYADRGSLQDRIDQRIRSGTPFSAPEALAISTDIAQALDAAHKTGIVHRDLKPSNILFRTTTTPFGAIGELQEVDTPPERLILADFGIARQLAAGSGLTIAAGTPNYMAPEQASPRTSGAVDQRGDIYSAAAVMFEMLTGDVPIPAGSMSEVARRQQAIHAGAIRGIRPDVPARLEQVILRGLARDPDDRFTSAADWAGALRAASRDDAPTITDGGASNPAEGVASNHANMSGAPPGSGQNDEDSSQVPPARPGWLIGSAIAGALVLLIACVASIYLIAANGFFDDDEAIAGSANGATPETSSSESPEATKQEEEPGPAQPPAESPTPIASLTPSPSPTATSSPTPTVGPTPGPEPDPDPVTTLANQVIPSDPDSHWRHDLTWDQYAGIVVDWDDTPGGGMNVHIQAESPRRVNTIYSIEQLHDSIIHVEIELLDGMGTADLACRSHGLLREDERAGHSGFYFIYNFSDHTYRYWRTRASGDGESSDWVRSPTSPSGQTRRLTLKCEDDSYSGWIDDELVFNVNDDEPYSGRMAIINVADEGFSMSVEIRDVRVYALD